MNKIEAHEGYKERTVEQIWRTRKGTRMFDYSLIKLIELNCKNRFTKMWAKICPLSLGLEFDLAKSSFSCGGRNETRFFIRWIDYMKV